MQAIQEERAHRRSSQATPVARLHPVHGAEDERDTRADEEPRRIVLGCAPVRAQVLQQEVPQLGGQRPCVAPAQRQRQL